MILMAKPKLVAMLQPFEPPLLDQHASHRTHLVEEEELEAFLTLHTLVEDF
ncbi:hypothetical protein Hanom_Chr11g01003721 [Helianthus anomalus]